MVSGRKEKCLTEKEYLKLGRIDQKILVAGEKEGIKNLTQSARGYRRKITNS